MQVRAMVPVLQWRPAHAMPVREAKALGSRWRITTFLAAILLALASPIAVRAQGSPVDEQSIKAAFLFHFAQFVEWPADTFPDNNSPLTYCTLGDDPFHGTLDASLSGKTVGLRPLRVRHLKAPQDVQGCHVLFLGAAEKKSMSTVFSSVQGKPILTVGETDHFVSGGGIIGFCLVENKVRFEVNLDSAEKARLKISSRLLSLAKLVVSSSGEK